MSSRIYTGDHARPASPVVWPQLDRVSTSLTGQPGSTGAEASREAELQREIERRVQEARSTGYQEGLASAQAAAAAEIKALDERVAQTIAGMAELRPKLRRQAESDLVKLALAIARRILHRELAVDPEAMRGLIQAALEALQSQELCRVRIHPSQEALVRSMLERSRYATSVDFHADPALDRGAAFFETARGNLDASVDTQLREIEHGLTDRLERA